MCRKPWGVVPIYTGVLGAGARTLTGTHCGKQTRPVGQNNGMRSPPGGLPALNRRSTDEVDTERQQREESLDPQREGSPVTYFIKSIRDRSGPLARLG